jgi:hypothetical protein
MQAIEEMSSAKVIKAASHFVRFPPVSEKGSGLGSVARRQTSCQIFASLREEERCQCRKEAVQIFAFLVCRTLDMNSEVFRTQSISGTALSGRKPTSEGFPVRSDSLHRQVVQV